MADLRSVLRTVGRLISNLGEPPAPKVLTNRNQLLRADARTEGDSCGAFVEGEPGDGDCDTDGHYLCAECSRMSHGTAYDRGLIKCTDCDEAMAPTPTGGAS